MARRGAWCVFLVQALAVVGVLLAMCLWWFFWKQEYPLLCLVLKRVLGCVANPSVHELESILPAFQSLLLWCLRDHFGLALQRQLS
jgi:hypothetical protein